MSEGSQLRGELAEGDCFDAGRERIPVRRRVDDQTPAGLEVGTGDVKSLLELRSQAALDLDGPAPTLGQIEHEVDFGAGRGSVEARRGAPRRGSDEVLEDEPPAPATG